MHGWLLLYGNALVLVGFHIDFALVLISGSTGTEEENNLIKKKKVMEYYFSKTINDSFENAIEKVTAALKVEGFGVLTEIDLKATLKKDVDFYNYTILEPAIRLPLTKHY
jgi:hypothetical protein